MNCRRQFVLCNDVHHGSSIEIFVPSSTVKVCIWKSQKTHSTRGKIYYEIKQNFCVDTLNESCYE